MRCKSFQNRPKIRGEGTLLGAKKNGKIGNHKVLVCICSTFVFQSNYLSRLFVYLSMKMKVPDLNIGEPKMLKNSGTDGRKLQIFIRSVPTIILELLRHIFWYELSGKSHQIPEGLKIPEALFEININSRMQEHPPKNRIGNLCRAVLTILVMLIISS